MLLSCFVFILYILVCLVFVVVVFLYHSNKEEWHRADCCEYKMINQIKSHCFVMISSKF